MSKCPLRSAGCDLTVPDPREHAEQIEAPAELHIEAIDPPKAISAVVEPPMAPPVVDVRELDWQTVETAVDPAAIRARMRAIVERMEALLDRAHGPGLLFDADRAYADDRAIRVAALDPARPLWIVGDLHGDLLALEAALALIDEGGLWNAGTSPRIVFLGDLFDDEGFGLEVLLRVFELIVNTPELICILAGNHDEALSYDGVRAGAGSGPPRAHSSSRTGCSSRMAAFLWRTCIRS